MQPLPFFDTSALMKVYCDEVGSACVRRIVADNTRIAVSATAYAEFHFACARLYADGMFKKRQIATVLRNFATDWQKLVVVEFNSETRKFIPKIAVQVRLKAADGIQLACGMRLAHADIPVIFVTADKKLFAAAKSLQMPLLNPETGERWVMVST